MYLKMLSVKWRPFCLSLNVLRQAVVYQFDHESQSSNTSAPIKEKIQSSISNFDAIKYWMSYIRVNSLAPGKFEWNFRYLIFQIISMNDGWGISCELALGWMSLDLTDDKSTLVQVMAWCCQAPSHYLSQCWPGSQSPYGVTRPQWVK